MLVPDGFLEAGIAVGVVSQVVPYQVVVQVLGGYTMEAGHEILQPAMVAVDTLYSQRTAHSPV